MGLILRPSVHSGVLRVEQRVHTDARGYASEIWSRNAWIRTGLPIDFTREFVSVSEIGVLRGLHYERDCIKTVTVLAGEIFDVVVDMRLTSPTYKQHVSFELSGRDLPTIVIPALFAHGFFVRSPTAILLYRMSTEYDPQLERGVAWNDPQLAIDWPACDERVISERDQKLPKLAVY